MSQSEGSDRDTGLAPVGGLGRWAASLWLRTLRIQEPDSVSREKVIIPPTGAAQSLKLWKAGVQVVVWVKINQDRLKGDAQGALHCFCILRLFPLFFNFC